MNTNFLKYERYTFLNINKIILNTQLSNLNTNFYYTSLNGGYDNCQHVEFYNAAKVKLKENHLNEEVSEQILKGLCYVYRKSFVKESVKYICNFLYYWLGDILSDKMSNKVVFLDVIRDLFNILENHKGKICTAPINYHINVENFKNIKLFFDYSEDYNNYIGQLNTHNPPCNEKYKNYLQKYVDTYNKFQRECQDKRTYYGYCDLFNKYFDKKNPTHLSKWTCKLDNNEPEAEKTYDETEEMETQRLPAYEMRGQATNSIGRLKGGREEGTEYPSPSNYLPHEDASVNNISSDSSDGTPSTITSKSITGAVSVAGALVPSYLLYNVISIMINKCNALLYTL
ncbi:hypothetical protein PVNG_05438 [Plasmodium vivax North Korean]|uniref:Variable surface protein Vir7-like protein n=2 Tax=Plasmodium vivax TaxID=5855 RepID=A0A0J9W727_PLAVI|nr:hypothetical protein PVNG_05438 [Plasmodium vivax North Korean]